MEDKTEAVSDERRRKKWLRGLARRLGKTAEFMPGVLPPGGAYPEWVRKVEREFAAAILPVARVRELDRLKPKVAGALIGNACALAVYFIELLADGAKAMDEPAQVAAGGQADVEAEPPAKEEPRLAEWYEAMRQLAKHALSSSVDQNYQDMSDFLSGFAGAFAGKPKTMNLRDMGHTTFDIYLFLLLCWRYVEGLKSVHQLHAILVKWLGPYQVGELKRVEKICQRVGLHYRKPGRPRKGG